MAVANGGVMTGTGIVVGYDGSADAEQAVAWAAREAQARGCALTVCLVQELPYPPYPTSPAGTQEPGDSALHGGHEALARGLRIARDLIGADEVRPLVATGSPAAILCKCAATAEMTVLGCRGRDGLPGLPLGSVSLKVAAQAPGRVVVVRGHWQPVPGQMPRPVVVGSDGSPASQHAVRFGFEEAALRETFLVAVCALADGPGQLGGAGRLKTDFQQIMSQEQPAHPDVAVNQQVCEGTARTALLQAARDAQLLVLGARGRGGIPGMSLGSASMTLLSHAVCPVAIVHADQGVCGPEHASPAGPYMEPG
jgi:nucleotide-binding universal stress UspA family protein